MPAWLTEASAVPPPLPCPAGPACFEVSLGNPPPPQVRGRPLQLPLPNLHCTLCLSRRPLFLGSPPPPHMLWRDDPGTACATGGVPSLSQQITTGCQSAPLECWKGTLTTIRAVRLSPWGRPLALACSRSCSGGFQGRHLCSPQACRRPAQGQSPSCVRKRTCHYRATFSWVC